MQEGRTEADRGQPNVLGKYRLIAELAHGGMADVFLAVASGPAGFNKLVVIKQIRSQLVEDPEFLAMFLDEARLAARLSHPNVVQTNEVGADGGRYFMAMEYLDGQPLNRIVNRLIRHGQPMSLPMHLRVLVEVCAGLHHAHELADYDGTRLEVVHRDVSPHNVFVTYDGQVKLVDFGVAKALSSSAETRAGVLKGKVAYMSPEQVRGDRVDRRADIFSVGIMLWEAATESRLWKGMSDIAIMQKLVAGGLPKPSSVRPDVSPMLEAVCMQALSHAREERQSTAAELGSQIEAVIEHLGARVSARDIGAVVASTFAQDRARLRATIESQLKSAKELRTDEYRSVSLPKIVDHLTTQSGPHSNSNPPGSGMTPSGQRASQPMLTPSSPSTPGPVSTTPPAPARTQQVFAAIGAAAFLTVAALLYVSWRGGAHPGADGGVESAPVGPQAGSVATGAAPTGPAATVVTAASGRVRVKLAASPKEAKLFFDDRPVDNPFTGELPRDGRSHEVRAEASGFDPRTRSVTLDQDVDVKLTLEPKGKGVAAVPGRPGRPEPEPEPEDDMKPKAKPKRTLDPENPYAQ